METREIHNVNNNKIKITCEICNTEVFVTPCFANIRRFCSLKCKHIGMRKIKDDSLRQCNKCKKILPLLTGFYGTEEYEYRCKECSKQRAKSDARTTNGRFRSANYIAKKRKHEWDISKEQYIGLLKYPCHYCGEDLNPTSIGLDRKDNNHGYTIKNVVPCCCRCNRTRGDNFSYEEMLILAKTIKFIVLARDKKTTIT